MLKLAVIFSTLALFAFESKQKPSETDEPDIAARLKKYVHTPMPMDLSRYSAQEKAFLKELIEVARLVHEIFWRQTYHNNIAMREEIEKNRAPEDPVRKFFFMQMGPFDRLAHNEPFLSAPPKPPGAGFYPTDMTKEEFEKWIADHPEDRESFLDPYTVIRRKHGRLVAVPYHEEYKEFVVPMAEKLKRAAQLANHEGLRKYLETKAHAVLTDNYFETDVAWIDMQGNKFDIVIGPFEVYEDELNNIKAAYEASVEIVDQEESAKLDVYKKYLAEMEADLPYPDEYKNKATGLSANFAIVRDIYRSGDIYVGYQGVATNLPNDPEVHKKKGSKKTFWKNIMDARLNQIILPVGKRVIAEEQAFEMTPQGYFNFVLMHEIAHGLGPRYVHGTETPVNEKLRELYSWIEENKADMAGLHSLDYLQRKGVIDPALRKQHYTSYLGSIFRTIRFGTGEAHGKAAIVSLNFLMEQGGIRFDSKTKRYSVDFDKIDDGITKLAEELLMIEATGDYHRAKKLEAKYAGTPAFLQESLDGMKDLPIDLVPVYQNKWE